MIRYVNHILNGKATIIILTVELMGKIQLYKMIYFLEPHTHSKPKQKLNQLSYATKSELKNATGAGRSDFAKTTDLAGLILDVVKLDIDKFKNLPSSLSNLLMFLLIYVS